jgi:hypothetical protein
LNQDIYKIEKKNRCFCSLDVLFLDGPGVDVYECSQQDNEEWIWNPADSTVRRLRNGQCLTVRETLEIWAGPLSDGSQAVVLFNRANTGSEPITVSWKDLGLSSDGSAVVRDLWARKDIGTFTGSYTSPNINFHEVMMLKITPTK